MAGDAPPYVRMEVAFGVDPLSRPADGDWVSVGVLTVGGEAVTVGGDPVYAGDGAGLRIRQLKTQRGGNVRTGEIETGEASAEIDDLDGALDPSNTASPFAPDVKLRTRVRFVVGPTDGDEFVVWTGFFNRMPIRWRRMLARTTLTASGLLWLAGDINLPPSVLHQTIVDLEPVAYWPLTESSGRHAEDVIGVLDGTLTKPLVGNQDLVPFDSRPNIHFVEPDDADPNGQRARVSPVSVASEDFTLSAWFRMTGDLPNNTLMRFRTASLTRLAFGLVESAGDTIAYLTANDGTNFDQVESEPVESVWDRKTHHLAVTVDGSSGAVAFYFDARPIAVSATSTDPDVSSVDFATLIASVTQLDMGWATSLNSSTTDYTGVVGHVAWWDSVLTSSQIETIWDAGTNPWAGDLTGTRLGRVLDICGIDAGDRDIDAGTVTCGPTSLDSQPLTTYLRKIAATEGGTVYEDAEGRIAFRQHVTNDPTPEVTFSDDPDGDSGSAVGPVEPDYATDRLINIAEVVRESGVGQIATDLASRTQYGPKTTRLDTLHQTPSGARGRANELVYRNNEPRLIFRQVDAHYLDTALATMTALDVQDAAEIIVRPPRGGDPIQQTTLVERVTHRFERDWVASFGLVEHIVLPWFSWDTTDAGFDQSAWSTTS